MNKINDMIKWIADSRKPLENEKPTFRVMDNLGHCLEEFHSMNECMNYIELRMWSDINLPIEYWKQYFKIVEV